jgi:uncharacterized protein
MKNILVVSFIILSSIVNANGQLKIKKTYDSLHRIAYISYYQNNKPTRIISFYANGKKKVESNFNRDGNFFGKQIDYYENGNKKLERFIIGVESVPYRFVNDSASNDLFRDGITGKWISYHVNGKKKAEGYIVHGMQVGYWSFYNEDGSLERKELYKCLTDDAQP